VAKSSQSKIRIKSFRAVSNGALGSEQLPARIKILDWGTSKANDGTDIILDDASVSVFNSNQARIGRARVALDMNHCTVPGTQAYKDFGSNPTIFAYGSPSIVPGDGLFLEDLKWTPAASNAKSFEDISPTPLLDNGRVVALHSAALTPAGAIADLHFFSACETLDEVIKALSTEPTKTIPMLNPTLAKFASEYKLPETATEADVEAAIRLALKPLAAPETKPLNADDLKALVAQAVGAQITPLTAKITELENERVEIGKAAEKAERAAILAEATKDGKIMPLSAEQIEQTPIGILKTFVAALPKAQVPTKRGIKPLAADGKTALTGKALTAAVWNESIEARN
jgi:hypothetical protein